MRKDRVNKKARTTIGALRAIASQGLNRSEYEKYLNQVTEEELWKYTIPELMLALEITRQGIPFKSHYPTHLNYELDFFIPINELAEAGPKGIAVECDIKFWHDRTKAKDKRRDFEMAQYSRVITIRFNDNDIYKNLQHTGQIITKVYQVVREMDGLSNIEFIVNKIWKYYKKIASIKSL